MIGDSMSEFEPTIVYKDKGPHSRPGGTFSYKGVTTQEQFDEAIAEGWLASYAELYETADDAPPTRAELEQKATELGIKFDGRTGDKKLGELIAQYVKEKA